MTRYAPPTADPDALRAAAARLTAAAGALHGSGAVVAGAGLTAAWTGTAAALALARTADLRTGTDRAAGALPPLARAATRYAEQVDDARAAVARLEQSWQDGLERARRQAAAAEQAAREHAAQVRRTGERTARQVHDDGTAAWRELSADLDRRYAVLCDDLSDAGRALARALEERDPLVLLPGWAVGGLRATQAGIKGWGVGSRTPALARYARVVQQTAQWYRLSSPVVGRALLASQEAQALRAVLHGAPRSGLLGGARTVLGRAFLPLAVLSGGVDALTGGGHGGLRGAATRLAGAAGAVGGGALLAGAAGLTVLGPVGLAVAGAAVLGYAAFSLGTLVYDSRQEIGAFLGRTAAAAASAGSAVRDGTVALGRRAAEAGSRVLDVVTAPSRLLPSLGGLF